jgi:NAD+ kinase
MRIAIHGRKIDDKSRHYVQQLIQCIREKQAEILVSSSFIKSLKDIDFDSGGIKSFNGQSGLESVDFVLSVGGDGTLLETVSYVGPLELPIVAINTGRLGFLATISKEMIPQAVDALYQNESHSNIEPC